MNDRVERSDLHPREREDVFDRLMRLPLLNLLEPFYRAHKQALLYLFFGALTFFVSIASYALYVTI